MDLPFFSLPCKKFKTMGIFGNLFGGGHHEGAARFNNLVDTLKTDLHLSDDQAQKILTSLQSFRQARKDVKSSGGDKTDMQTARQELRQNILGTLNDQQKQSFLANAAKYDELMHPNKQ